MKTLDILSYKNYRIFISDWVKSHGHEARGLYKKMAETIGVSNVLLSQVVRGSQNIQLESAIPLAQFLGLSGLTSEYFLLLIQKDRAGSKLLADHFEKKLSEIVQKSKNLDEVLPKDRELSESEKAQFYTHWMYSGVRLAISIDPHMGIEDLSQKLNLTRESVEEALHFLIEHKLIYQTGDGFVLGPQRLHLAANSPFIKARQVSWRVKAFEAMDRKLNESELFFTAPMSISRAHQKDIRRQLVQMIEEISKRTVDEKPEVLVDLNFDFFEI